MEYSRICAHSAEDRPLKGTDDVVLGEFPPLPGTQTVRAADTAGVLGPTRGTVATKARLHIVVTCKKGKCLVFQKVFQKVFLV